jgi:hypothetical protein
VISSYKILNHLKKNKLTKQLILISKNPVGIKDTKLLVRKDYSLLDLLAFMLQAECISFTKNTINKNIFNSLRLNISIKIIIKDYITLLSEITDQIPK